MVLPVMKGGGAERVAAQLSNGFAAADCSVTFVLTSSDRSETVNTDLSDSIPVVWLRETDEYKNAKQGKGAAFLSSAVCKRYEAAGKAVPADAAKYSFTARYGGEIAALRKILSGNPGCTVISFLQPSIPVTMLAADGLDCRVVFSERGDPGRLMKQRYGFEFVKKYYARADAAVFQTDTAKSIYPQNIAEKGTVISNPVKAGLPAAYHGERSKSVTTFCRISKQKNLPLLLEAFSKLHGDEPEYVLRIIGDTLNEEGDAVLAELKRTVSEKGLENSVVFEPFRKNIHEAVIRDAMYVNSSDYEGISNAMLEALAIGMPCVCTDCPVGGASATITDGENGLLVPCGDAEKLYGAMKRIVSEDGLAEKLSLKAAEIRSELSLDNTVKKWMEIM